MLTSLTTFCLLRVMCATILQFNTKLQLKSTFGAISKEKTLEVFDT